MKKVGLLAIFLSFLLIFSACTAKKLEKPRTEPKNMTEEEINIKNYEKNLETDVNFIDIKEDEEMTITAKNRKGIDHLLNSKNEKKEGNINQNLTNLVVTKKFNIDEKPSFNVNLKYDKYLMPKEYLLITEENTKIYAQPSFNANEVGKAYMFEKVKLLNEVKGESDEKKKSDRWYNIAWTDDKGNRQNGFIHESKGIFRNFRFKEMYNSIKNLENSLANKHGYISNYKDKNGSPPLINNKGLDKYGMQAYQSAPAYFDLNNKSDFRYFPDGMIVLILGDVKGYFKVKSLDYEGEYWVPKEYVSFENNLDKFTKAVVVDTLNQNEGVFEKRGDNWTMISYNLATTGEKGERKFETPVGKFKVLEKRDKFYYLDDQTKEIAGYSPFGVRFAQGAYIHGVPVEYTKKEGKLIDPGLKEYLFTIGTVPRSHKCVRNYTSHAKFIYDWVDPNDTAVIVIK